MKENLNFDYGLNIKDFIDSNNDELSNNDIIHEGETVGSRDYTIHFDLSCIEDEDLYKRELMKFEYPDSVTIKEFISNLDKNNLRRAYVDDRLIYSNKYATIVINDIYYSYNTFEIKVAYSISANYIKYNKNRRYGSTFFEVLSDYNAYAALGRIINLFKNNGYIVSSGVYKNPEFSGRCINFNNGELTCLVDSDLNLFGCSVRKSLKKTNFVKYNKESLEEFIGSINDIYNKYRENKLSKDATPFISKYINKSDQNLNNMNSITYSRLKRKLNYIESGLISRGYTACHYDNTHNVSYNMGGVVDIYILNIKVTNPAKKTGNKMTAIICAIADNNIYTLDGDTFTYSDGKFISINSNKVLDDIEIMRAEIPDGYRVIMNII